MAQATPAAPLRQQLRRTRVRGALIVRASKRMWSKGAAFSGRSANSAITAPSIRSAVHSRARTSACPCGQRLLSIRIGEERQTVAPDDLLKSSHLVGWFPAVSAAGAALLRVAPPLSPTRPRRRESLPRRLARHKPRGGPRERIRPWGKRTPPRPTAATVFAPLLRARPTPVRRRSKRSDRLKLYYSRAPTEPLWLQSIERVRHGHRRRCRRSSAPSREAQRARTNAASATLSAPFKAVISPSPFKSRALLSARNMDGSAVRRHPDRNS